MATALASRPVAERALDVLRRAGNPFRNCFARNPDDDSCSRCHVPELYALQREQLLAVVDLYRYAPATPSEVVPVLGNKGAGKTHLLHSIKHGGEGGWQLLVTPGVYQKDAEFLEYMLFQLIDTMLGGGKQRGMRPLEYVGEQLVRGLLVSALGALSPAQRLDLFRCPACAGPRSSAWALRRPRNACSRSSRASRGRCPRPSPPARCAGRATRPACPPPAPLSCSPPMWTAPRPATPPA